MTTMALPSALPNLAEPVAHARGMSHPRPVPGCPWCPPTSCPCGGRCADPAGCWRRWAAAETTWRELARAGAR